MGDETCEPNWSRGELRVLLELEVGRTLVRDKQGR